MIITIKRTEIAGERVDGTLAIDGTKICDTSENANSCIPVGIYTIIRHRCKQTGQSRFVPLITLCGELMECSRCPQLNDAGPDTILPCFCPQFKIGSGIHNRHDGRIIVGTRVVSGVVEHSLESFEIIAERIRKCVARGRSVTLIIEEE